MIKYNITKITKENLNYPQILKEINSSPKQLYIIGNTELLRKKSVAIVGTRNCTKYGANTAEKLAYNLSNQNIIIVSGLARGIDKYAHIGALKAGGKTIAVVAHGLDMIYPSENRELAKNILYTGGTIISEYKVGTKPLKENFPARNRIISGISVATIIVEAEEKSGSLITANFALEQGRSLYAVPGSIYSKSSIGTNRLIKNGAGVILEDYNLDGIDYI